MRAAIYTRVSTADQAREGFSMDEQERKCKEYIEREGWTLSGVYREPGVSGSLEHRPALDRLVAAADDLDVVVVNSLDRLGRSTKNLLELYDVFGAKNTSLVFIREHLDTTTPVGRLLRTILAAIAEFERELIIDRTTTGIGARAKTGKPWGEPKFGYVKDDDGNVVVEPGEAATVALIFRYRVEGRLSYSAVARRLVSENVPSRRRGGTWTPTTVKKVCESRYCLGEFEHNGEWIQGTHPAIISEETYAAAQALAALGSKYAPGRGGRRPARHLFVNGHARCVYCGESLLPRSLAAGDVYQCRTNRQISGDGSCEMPTLRREDVDGRWLRFFERTLLDVRATRDRFAAEMAKSVARITEDLDAAETAVARLEASRAKVERDYLYEDLDAASYALLSSRLTDEEAAALGKRDRLAASAGEARRVVSDADAETETLRRLVALRDSIAADARAAQESGDLEALRAISRELAEEVAWGVDADGNATIVGITPGSALLAPTRLAGEDVAAFHMAREHAIPFSPGKPRSDGETYPSGTGVPEGVIEAFVRALVTGLDHA